MARRSIRPTARRTWGGARYVVPALVVLVALALTAAPSATALPSSAVPTAAPAAVRPADAGDPGDTVTLQDPVRSDISLTVTTSSGPLSQVRQGDTVHLHFSGLGAGDSVGSVGTCPGDLPVKQMDLGANAGTTGSIACLARIPTGLGADVDPNSANNPSFSPYLTNLYSALDKTLDVDFLVGSGTSVGSTASIIRYRDVNKPQTIVPSLTCDATHTCVIGFVVKHANQTKPASAFWTDLTSLTIAPPPATGADTRGCTGLDSTRTVTATGPDRLLTPVSALDRAYCEKGASPIPVSLVPSALGEGDPSGVPAVGTTADLAFIGSPALTKTPVTSGQVLVPLALNAVSVAQFGGFVAPSVTPHQIGYGTVQRDPLSLTTGDVAGIVLHRYATDAPTTLPTTLAEGKAANPLAAQLLQRPGNAAALAGVDPSLIGLPFYAAPTVTYGVGVSSTAVALSAYLAAGAPTDWSFPSNAINVDLARAGKAVGPISDFASLVDQSPKFTGNILTSETSSVAGLYAAKLSKDISKGAFAGLCPNFSASAATTGPAYAAALTRGCLRFGVMDTQTASAMSFQSARLPAGTSGTAGTTYVGPTSDSLQAAAQGTLTKAGYFAGASGAAYPLTFVEYAVVPKAPLLDDSCKPRAQQDLLKSFLTYAVGDGQSHLSAGLAPLSSALRTQATAAIAAIGTGAPTGACAPKPTPKPSATPTSTPTATPTATPSPTVPVDGGSGNGDGGSGSGVTSGSGTLPSPVSTTPDSVAETQRLAAASSSSEPKVALTARPVALQVAAFQGATGTPTTSTALGLVALVLLLALGALWSSGRLTANVGTHVAAQRLRAALGRDRR